MHVPGRLARVHLQQVNGLNCGLSHTSQKSAQAHVDGLLGLVRLDELLLCQLKPQVAHA